MLVKVNKYGERVNLNKVFSTTFQKIPPDENNPVRYAVQFNSSDFQAMVKGNSKALVTKHTQPEISLMTNTIYSNPFNSLEEADKWLESLELIALKREADRIKVLNKYIGQIKDEPTTTGVQG